MLEFQEKCQDLRDQIDQKEYVLQYIQIRYNKLEEFMKSLALKYSEIRGYLQIYDKDNYSKTGKITNVLQENNIMKNELEKIHFKINNLYKICVSGEHENDQNSVKSLDFIENTFLFM